MYICYKEDLTYFYYDGQAINKESGETVGNVLIPKADKPTTNQHEYVGQKVFLNGDYKFFAVMNNFLVELNGLEVVKIVEWKNSDPLGLVVVG